MQKAVKIYVYKRFTLYSDIMKYLDIVKEEYAKFNIKYTVDIYYNEFLNDYKLIIMV